MIKKGWAKWGQRKGRSAWPHHLDNLPLDKPSHPTRVVSARFLTATITYSHKRIADADSSSRSFLSSIHTSLPTIPLGCPAQPHLLTPLHSKEWPHFKLSCNRFLLLNLLRRVSTKPAAFPQQCPDGPSPHPPPGTPAPCH